MGPQDFVGLWCPFNFRRIRCVRFFYCNFWMILDLPMTGQVPRQLIMDLGDLNVLLFDLWYNLNHSLPLISGLDFPLFRFAAYLRLLYQDIVLWFFILQRCCMLWVDLMGRVSQIWILNPQLKNLIKQYESWVVIFLESIGYMPPSINGYCLLLFYISLVM